jgi:hypothetical protein
MSTRALLSSAPVLLALAEAPSLAAVHFDGPLHTRDGVLVRPELTVTLGSRDKLRLGFAVEAEWQRFWFRDWGFEGPAYLPGGEERALAGPHGGATAGGAVSVGWTDDLGWTAALLARAGAERADVPACDSGNALLAAAQGELGLFAATAHAVGLRAGAIGTASYGEARATALLPFAGPATGQVGGGVAVPLIVRHLCPMGRPVRIAGRRLVARAPDGPAGAWLQRANDEGASVATFERLRLELRALGAPDGLVARAAEAEADERLHAVLCAGMAARYGGPAVAIAPRIVGGVGSGSALAARVAVEAWVDGVGGEADAARMALAEAEREPDPVGRRVLRRIARDEARHASLAAKVVEFCRARNPEVDRVLDRLG